MLALIVFGCSSIVSGLLRLQDRELLIHPDKPGLAYPHMKKECKERKKPWRWLGKKCEMVHAIDFYDFNLKDDRDKLINAGFSCKSSMRFKY